MKPFIFLFICPKDIREEKKGGNGKGARGKISGVVIWVGRKCPSVAIQIILTDFIVMPKVGHRIKHGNEKQGKGERGGQEAPAGMAAHVQKSVQIPLQRKDGQTVQQRSGKCKGMLGGGKEHKKLSCPEQNRVGELVYHLYSLNCGKVIGNIGNISSGVTHRLTMKQQQSDGQIGQKRHYEKNGSQVKFLVSDRHAVIPLPSHAEICRSCLKILSGNGLAGTVTIYYSRSLILSILKAGSELTFIKESGIIILK